MTTDTRSPDILSSLPLELQHAVLYDLLKEGGIQCLFPPRRVCRIWCRLIDDYLYQFFMNGPDVLYCYVNLWNRFRQKLIQQRVTLRLRVRTMQYHPKSEDLNPSQPSKATSDETGSPNIVSWQPSTKSSENPSLAPREYTAYIYDACFDAKYNSEYDLIYPVDINPRTPRPISLGSGLTKLLEKTNQPPRSGTIFPLFHVIQEAWDFILGEDATLMPIYPPIASEAWLQIRLATGPVAGRFREPPAIYIEPSHDPFWPFRLDEYSRFPGERNTLAGQHQFAVVSRLALPNLVEDEGILLVTVRDTEVSEWIQDTRYREIMQSMIAVADVGGPQEFILGGAVVQLEDFERFIPGGMVGWFRRRILEKRTSSATPASEGNMSKEGEEKVEEGPSSTSRGRNGNMLDGVMARLHQAMGGLGDDRREGEELPPDIQNTK